MKLHIINNEKITQRTISIFEKAFPDDNKFIVLDTVIPRFDTRNFRSEILFVNKKNKNDFWKAVGDITKYQHVIIHFLSYELIKLFGKVSHSSIFWIEWGADLYINMLYPRGFQLFENPDCAIGLKKPNWPLPIVKFLYWWQRKIYQRQYLQFVRRVKYFVPDSMPGEYELLLSYYPELSHLEYRPFFYYPIDSIVTDRTLVSKGINIMINHCATLTGNHIGVLDKLSQLDIKDKGIVIPVSYGNKKYAKEIENKAKGMFGDKISLITKFMPLEEYNKILEGCDVFIYGHYRQEAVGNILIALFLGGKVFLHNYNPLLNFYKSIGLSIFSIEDDLTSEFIHTKLSESEILKNKKIIEEYYSEAKLLQLTKESFE